LSEDFSGQAAIDGWLEPLGGSDGPCGADFEYDNDFLALTQAAAGKPETQFEAAVPPDWRAVRSQAEALLERSRDLRVAILWLRALLNLEGFVALAPGLELLHALLEKFWDQLHPLPDPDDGDPYARMNALAQLPDAASGLADVRRAVLFSARGVGEVRVRAVEVALGLTAPRDDEPALGRDQLAQMLTAAIAQDPGLRERPAAALAALKRLAALASDRAGVEGAPDFKPLQSLLNALCGVMPAQEQAVEPEAESAQAEEAAQEPSAARAASARGLAGGVHSRDDALRAIDMVCDYLERTEPTNPAQLLLRRARRLINHNFLQLMKELAPDALADVARVMGVDPESVQVEEP
jgi:type VI secretion system protein ImpA